MTRTNGQLGKLLMMSAGQKFLKAFSAQQMHII